MSKSGRSFINPLIKSSLYFNFIFYFDLFLRVRDPVEFSLKLSLGSMNTESPVKTYLPQVHCRVRANQHQLLSTPLFRREDREFDIG